MSRVVRAAAQLGSAVQRAHAQTLLRNFLGFRL